MGQHGALDEHGRPAREHVGQADELALEAHRLHRLGLQPCCHPLDGRRAELQATGPVSGIEEGHDTVVGDRVEPRVPTLGLDRRCAGQAMSGQRNDLRADPSSHASTPAPMRATERQRRSGDTRPAWPGNAGNTSSLELRQTTLDQRVGELQHRAIDDVTRDAGGGRHLLGGLGEGGVPLEG